MRQPTYKFYVGFPWSLIRRDFGVLSENASGTKFTNTPSQIPKTGTETPTAVSPIFMMDMLGGGITGGLLSRQNGIHGPWNLPARNPRVPKKASWPSHIDLHPKWMVGAAHAWVRNTRKDSASCLTGALLHGLLHIMRQTYQQGEHVKRRLQSATTM